MTPVALVTGGARRIGAAIARALHSEGYRVIIHHHHSVTEATALCRELNQARPDSAALLAADLACIDQTRSLADAALQCWQRLDAIVNNASMFYPTPLATATDEQWRNLMDTNLRAPFSLVQALADELRRRRGRIVNIVDINARYPLDNFSLYCITKAGLAMLTKSLALELAPQVQVNAIAPGAILWPEGNAPLPAEARQDLLAATPLRRLGEVDDIARLAVFLITSASYVTGQTIAVDGGLSLAGRHG
ncbi:MAG: pteridine reductase [Porticoccaceae bacterium]|nr:pteridine reductase [Porticoccaceae bacterium]